MTALLMSFVTYSRLNTREDQQSRLRIAVNRAVDAAVDEMIMRSGNTESLIPERVMLDPQIALDEFVDMLLMYYNLPTNEFNRDMVRNRFISVFIVATYDGYYVARQRQVNQGSNRVGHSFDLSFDPKMPYTYIHDPDNPRDHKYVPDSTGQRLVLYHETTPARFQNNTIYNLVLNSMYYYRIDPYSNITFHNGAVPPLAEGINLNTADGQRQYLEEVRAKINFIILEALRYHTEAVNKGSSTWAQRINIPLYGGSQSNPIFGPSVLVLMQDVMLESPLKLNIASIGGSVILRQDPILGYVDIIEGVPTRLYAHADEIPPGVTPTEIFPDARSAALAGYYCDTRVWNRIVR